MAVATGGVKCPLSLSLQGVEDWSRAPGDLSDLRALAGENALVSNLMCVQLKSMPRSQLAPFSNLCNKSDKMQLIAES